MPETTVLSRPQPPAEPVPDDLVYREIRTAVRRLRAICEDHSPPEGGDVRLARLEDIAWIAAEGYRRLDDLLDRPFGNPDAEADVELVTAMLAAINLCALTEHGHFAAVRPHEHDLADAYGGAIGWLVHLLDSHVGQRTEGAA